MLSYKQSLFQYFTSRRHTAYILKGLTALLILLIICIHYQSRYTLINDSNNISDISPVSILHKRDQDLVVIEDLKKLRQSVLRENFDEFLQVVLSEVYFIEVNFLSPHHTQTYSSYDDEINELEHKIVSGLGENGEKAKLHNNQQDLADQIEKQEAFNRILSEMISLNRSVPDTRQKECRGLIYDVNSLPTISVIIIFSNEALISILRTLHSVINRTPANLLKEIILVDDASNRQDLQGKLERYLVTKLPLHKIRLLRLSLSSGLTRARMIGAHVAIGDTLVFLDAHCEVNRQWSEPLLQRIKEESSAVVVPVIDFIDPKTLEYENTDPNYFLSGGFLWSGDFYWIPVSEDEERRKMFHYKPTRTPTMAGGLFAIDRRYFWEMGSYDPYLLGWGGENLEMSFRIWQCGGSIETIPCSRVGHLFREFRPYKFSVNDARKNDLRVAAVWMDEYKNFVFQNGVMLDFGDISRRIAFRERKKCKNFQWYLDYIYKEKFRLHLDSILWGQVSNVATGQCLVDLPIDEADTPLLQVSRCSPWSDESQTYYLSQNNELRKELLCARIDMHGLKVVMVSCDFANSDEFKWDFDNLGRIVNTKIKKCLTVKDIAREMGRNGNVLLEECGNSFDQKWNFYNSHNIIQS